MTKKDLKKNYDFIKELINTAEKENFYRWLEYYSPSVSCFAEYRLIRNLYTAVLTQLYNSDFETFSNAALVAGGLVYSFQMDDDEAHKNYHMNILNSLINIKLKELYKERFESDDKKDETPATIALFKLNKSTYEHHYKGEVETYTMKYEVMNKDTFMNNAIRMIKGKPLENVKPDELEKYQQWSKLADKYIYDINDICEKLISFDVSTKLENA